MIKHPLLSRSFLPLFITQFLGALNDNIFKNALIIYILFTLAPASGLNGQIYATAAAGIFILPFVIFSAIAGHLSDKFDKAQVMRVVKATEVCIVCLAGAAFYLQSASFLLFVLFLMGTHSAFFSPAKYSILPQHLPTKALVAGNGLLSSGTFVAILLGTIIGALCVAKQGGPLKVTFLSAAVAIVGLISSCFIPAAPADKHNKLLKVHPFKDSVDMLGLVLKEKELRRWSLAISWFWFLGASYLTQFPNIAKQSFIANEQVVTLFLTMFTLGVAAGSALCGKILKGKISTRLAPYAALALVIFGVDFYIAAKSFGHPYVVMDMPMFLRFGFPSARLMFDLFMTAVAGGIFYVPLYARVQSLTSLDHRARVMAGISFLNALFMVFSSLLGMALLSLGFSGLDVLFVTVFMTLFMAWYCKKL